MSKTPTNGIPTSGWLKSNGNGGWEPISEDEMRASTHANVLMNIEEDSRVQGYDDGTADAMQWLNDNGLGHEAEKFKRWLWKNAEEVARRDS